MLMRLERIFGKEALTVKWNNWARILQSCAREVKFVKSLWNGVTAHDIVAQVVRYIMWAVEREEAQATSVTMEWLDQATDYWRDCPGARQGSVCAPLPWHGGRAPQEHADI